MQYWSLPPGGRPTPALPCRAAAGRPLCIFPCSVVSVFRSWSIGEGLLELCQGPELWLRTAPPRLLSHARRELSGKLPPPPSAAPGTHSPPGACLDLPASCRSPPASASRLGSPGPEVDSRPAQASSPLLLLASSGTGSGKGRHMAPRTATPGQGAVGAAVCPCGFNWFILLDQTAGWADRSTSGSPPPQGLRGLSWGPHQWLGASSRFPQHECVPAGF